MHARTYTLMLTCTTATALHTRTNRQIPTSMVIGTRLPGCLPQLPRTDERREPLTGDLQVALPSGVGVGGGEPPGDGAAGSVVFGGGHGPGGDRDVAQPVVAEMIFRSRGWVAFRFARRMIVWGMIDGGYAALSTISIEASSFTAVPGRCGVPG